MCNRSIQWYLTALIFTLLIIACSKEKEVMVYEDCREETQNTVLLLKVDFTTYSFEGGFEQEISQGLTNSDTIPILVDIEAPMDFGNISLYYEPTNDLLFDGDVVWMGTGEIEFPSSFSNAESFTKTNSIAPLPDSTRIQLLLDWYWEPNNFNEVWNSINDLCIVIEYAKSNKTIGIFPYTPSVGVGNPAEWDWIIIMSK